MPDIPGPCAANPDPFLVCDGSFFTLAYRSAIAEGSDIIVIGGSGYYFQLGYPNDEALSGHTLYPTGLQHYTVHEILDSPLLVEMWRRNEMCFQNSHGLFSSHRHFVITFHDESFECISKQLDVIARYEATATPRSAALKHLP